MEQISALEYLDTLPDDRKEAMTLLRKVVSENIPSGLKEEISNGMIHYNVPHSIYSNGYHCNPLQPLPFISIASQKNFIAMYHMGIYADKDLLNWFTHEYNKISKTKLDMGKSCIRFKRINNIPYDLIGELCTKMSVESWIKLYESELKSK